VQITTLVLENLCLVMLGKHVKRTAIILGEHAQKTVDMLPLGIYSQKTALILEKHAQETAFIVGEPT